MLIYSVLSTFPLFVFSEVCLQKRIKKTPKINEKSKEIWYKMATSTGIIKISSFFGLHPLLRPIWSDFGSYRH